MESTFLQSPMYPKLESDGDEPMKEKRKRPLVMENKKQLEAVCEVGLACYGALNRCHPIITPYENDSLKKKHKRKYVCMCIPLRRPVIPQKVTFSSAFFSLTTTWRQIVEKVEKNSGNTLTKTSQTENMPLAKIEKAIEALSDVKAGPALIDNWACREAVCKSFFCDLVEMRRSLNVPKSGHLDSKTAAQKIHLRQDGNMLVLVGTSRECDSSYTTTDVTIVNRNTTSILEATQKEMDYFEKLKKKLMEDKGYIGRFKHIASGVKLYGGAKVRKSIARALKGTNVLLVVGKDGDPDSFELRVQYNLDHLLPSDVNKKLLMDFACSLHQVYNHFC